MTAAPVRGNTAGRKRAAAVAGAALVLAGSAGVAVLSHRVLPGDLALRGPILPMVSVLVLGALGYVLACTNLSRLPSSPIGFALVLVVAIAAAAVQLASKPVGNTDYARYLIDGGAVACGDNPYRLTPSERSRARATLSALAWSDDPPCFLDDPRWEQVFHLVENGGEVTPYPPLAALWFGAVVRAFGPSLLALRVSFLLAELALLVVLALLLERLGLTLLAVAVVGWAPLMFKEIVNSAHYDAVPALLLTLSLLFLANRKWVASLAVLGCVVAAKLFAVVLLPLWLRAVDPGRRGWPATLFVAGAVVWWLPFAGAGINVLAGVGGLATAAVANAPIFPSLAGRLAETVRDPALARAVLAACLLAGVTTLGLFYPVRSGGRVDVTRVARGAALILAISIVCGPLASPWYFVWILPLAAVDLRPSWLVLVATLPLFYLRYSMVPGSYAEHAWLVPWLEFGPPVLVALLEPLYLNRSSSRGRTRSAARPSPAL
ncbi:MAG: hypothetical protein D6760_02915 [Deltaproteobacteria bacterium]|nr:MAG: hypothetical protein D6760_02915 [Deltaproteobacteria bacterium]